MSLSIHSHNSRHNALVFAQWPMSSNTGADLSLTFGLYPNVNEIIHSFKSASDHFEVPQLSGHLAQQSKPTFCSLRRCVLGFKQLV